MRDSGLDEDIFWGTHFCQFYQTKKDLLDIILPYFKSGLENSEFCIWIPPESLNLEKVRETLRKGIPDFELYLEKGQIEIVPYNTWYLKDGIFDSQKSLESLTYKLDHALAKGYSGLRFAQDAFYQENDLDEFIEYEENLNSIVSELPIIVLCTYSLEMCSSNDIIKAATNHDSSLSKKRGKWEQIKNTNHKYKKLQQFKNAGRDSRGSGHTFPGEEKYREISNSIEEGVLLCELVFDEKGVAVDNIIIDANSAHEEHSGLKSEKIIGRHIKEILPIVEQIWLDRYAEVVRNGRKIHFEAYNASFDIWFEVYVSPLKDNRFIVSFSNITKRKQTEKALQKPYKEIQVQSERLQASEELEEAYEVLSKNERHYKALFINMPESFFVGEPIYDKDSKTYDYRFLEVNPAFELQTGLKREEILGKPATQVLNNPSRLLIEKYGEVTLSGKPIHVEVFSQELNRCLDNYIFCPEKDKFAVIVRDITDRKVMETALKRNEERLSDLVSSIQDGFFELDREWRFTYINKRAANNGNFEPEDLIGENIWEKFPYMVNTKFERAYREVMDTRLQVHFEIKSEIRDQWYEVSIYPSTAGISAFWRDITDRKLAEKALKEAYKEIQANSEKLQATNEELQVQTEELQNAYQALSESEKQYRDLFTNMTEAFLLGEIICDKDGEPCDYICLEANPAYELNSGVKKEDITGKSVLELFPNASRDAIKRYGTVALSGKPANFEFFSQALNRYLDVYVFSPEKGKFAVIFRDVTEQKRLEEQIRQHLEELETVMDVAPAAIWIGHDPRCNIITGNRMANEFYEVEDRENVSANITPLRRFFSNGRELAANELPMQESALKDSDIRNVEFDVLLPSGKRRSFLGSASPLHDSEGKVRGSVGTFIDITERKQQEEALNLAYEEIQLKSEELETQNEEIQEAYRALSESEEKYRKLFENMHEGFFIADIITDEAGKPVDYRIIEANQAFKAQTGIPGKELIGKTALEVYPDLDPLWVQTYGSVALTGSPAHFDRYADPYGRHYEVLAYQIQPGRFAAIFLDITERKQVEEKLQKALSKAEEGDRLLAALMENVPEGITISDAFGRLRMVSRSGEKLLGGAHSEKSIDEVVTQWMVYQPDGVTPMDTEDIPLVRAVQKGEIVQNAELVQVNTLGEKISLLCNAAPIRDSIGNITGGIVAWHDITERKKAEEALRESEERYRTLFNTMEEGFCIIEVLFDERKKPIDYVFVETNPAFELQTGLEAVVGKRIREIIPGNEDYWYEIYGRIALTGESVRFENRAEELNRWYEVYAYRIGEPEARKVAVIFNDITERKQTEEALRESQARLETVFSATPDAIIEYDVNGKPVRVNDAALKAYGLRLPSLTRDKAVAELKIEHTDGSPVRVEELPTSRALKGEIVEGELYRFTDAEGKELIITTYAAPLFKDNRVNGAVALWHDITELKQTEEELRKSENLYRAIAKNFPNGAIYVFDRNLRFLVAEGEALELISWSQEKLEGKSVYDLDEETRKIIEPRYRSVLAGESLVFETAYRGRHILSQYVPIRNDQGEIFAGLVVGIDITKRKTMEAELAHQRELLQRIFDNIPVLLVIWDPHMERFTLNRHVEQVLGWTTADANNGDFMAKVYPDPAYRAEVSSYMLSLRSGWKEWIGATKNGQHVPIEWANIFLTDDTMIGIGVDLRERKKAEAKLKETLDNLENLVKIRTAELEEAYNSLKESEKGLAEAQKMAHIGNWHLNLMTNKIYWSDEVYRIFGFKPQEFEVTYNAFLNYVHPEDRAYINNTIKKALNGESYGIDFRIISENGKERMVYLQGELVLDDRQLPVGMRGTIQDITERKRAEEALAKIDEFRIKEIHHRIKNNLQVISSLLDLQAETFSHLEVCKAPEVLKAFKESQSRIASMALIHEELYNCKGSDNLDFAAYLRKLATYLLNLYNLKATAVSLKLELEEVYLDMDTAIPLGIIVNELVSNSLKHAFPNGKKPELRIILQRIPSLNIRERLASDDGCKKDDFCFSLTVADNGRGISEKIDIQTVESLGLQLVNILVEQIDGCIELKRNGGTRFIILFNSMEN